MVIVLSDADVRVLKGEDRPIIPILQRAKIIDSLEMVDYVITTPPNSIKKSQNSARENVLWQKYWPIVRDSGASLAMRVDGTPPSFIKHLRNHGIEIIKHTRTRNISTNKIVEQIKKN